MKTSLQILIVLLLVSCGAGYHRVKYAEMPEPPRVTLKNNELIVTTRNEGGEGLSVYKVDVNIRDRARIIELRGFQAIGKSEKTEFKVMLSEVQLNKISDYRVYWLDPKGKKTRVTLSDKL
ncbi:unnamed protein product [Phaeothamnion confervicola]